MEKKHNRTLWINTLHQKFFNALKDSIKNFTWQEKTDFISALIEYTELLRKNEQKQAADFYTTNIMKSFKSKLKDAMKERLFVHFDQLRALTEFDIITMEQFNSLGDEQGMSDEEYQMYLSNLSRSLHNEQHFLYVNESATAENSDKELKGTKLKVNNKGRLERVNGDGLTKLNQSQTVLLIEYLRKGRIILKDEYCKNTSAGQAFALLTGYSEETIRQELGEKKIHIHRTKENLKTLRDALDKLDILIANDLKEIK